MADETTVTQSGVCMYVYPTIFSPKVYVSYVEYGRGNPAIAIFGMILLVQRL
jgi:hypothetical protein